MKDQIHNLVVTNSLACFIPQGTGVKVLLNYEKCSPLNGVGSLLLCRLECKITLVSLL